jgi:hypothetical protein
MPSTLGLKTVRGALAAKLSRAMIRDVPKIKVLAIARVVCNKVLCKCEVDPQGICVLAKINFLIKLTLF